MQHKMPMVCIETVHVHLRIHIYIRRGLQCCCLDVKAIPEPYEAEHFQGSAFLCVHTFEIVPTLPRLDSLSLVSRQSDLDKIDIETKRNINGDAESRIIKWRQNMQ